MLICRHTPKRLVSHSWKQIRVAVIEYIFTIYSILHVDSGHINLKYIYHFRKSETDIKNSELVRPFYF